MDDKLRIAMEIYQLKAERHSVSDHREFNDYIRKIIRVRRLNELSAKSDHLNRILDEVLA